MQNISIPWFEVEQIRDVQNVYSFAEPGHYEYVRSYLVIGKNEAALIDTGTGIDDIQQVVKHYTSLPIRVILTHTHWDHIGNAFRFGKVLLYNNQIELERLKKGYNRGSQEYKDLAQNEFRPKKFGRPLPLHINLDDFEIPGVPAANIEMLEDGDEIDLGDRKLYVMHTPGHTGGSICLWDEQNGLLFTGDTYYWGPLFVSSAEFSLSDYMKTAGILAALAPQVKRVLPAHNEIERNGRVMGGDDLINLRQAFSAIQTHPLSGRLIRIFDFNEFDFSIELREVG